MWAQILINCDHKILTIFRFFFIFFGTNYSTVISVFSEDAFLHTNVALLNTQRVPTRHACIFLSKHFASATCRICYAIPKFAPFASVPNEDRQVCMCVSHSTFVKWCSSRLRNSKRTQQDSAQRRCEGWRRRQPRRPRRVHWNRSYLTQDKRLWPSLGWRAESGMEGYRLRKGERGWRGGGDEASANHGAFICIPLSSVTGWESQRDVAATHSRELWLTALLQRFRDQGRNKNPTIALWPPRRDEQIRASKRFSFQGAVLCHAVEPGRWTSFYHLSRTPINSVCRFRPAYVQLGQSNTLMSSSRVTEQSIL